MTEPPDSGTDSHDEIAGFQLFELLGRGGMGETYLAMQLEPVRRNVAVKVIRADWLQGEPDRVEELRARFRREQQALALMNHPNIAQVFTAGETERGNLFFAMEFVAGTDIAQFCKNRCCDIESRSRLFLQCCDAIEHAHSKGVLHRDITHRNVLVVEIDDTPAVKVIDFGLAKSLGPDLNVEDCKTEIGRIVGTPQYLSPEQATPHPIELDRRADVYQLGVLLYYLLTDTFPYPLDQLRILTPGELQKVFKNIDPPSPRRRLAMTSRNFPEAATTIAADRGVSVSALQFSVPTDLAHVCMVALARDRRFRYASVAELARDVRHAIDGKPINARPPGVAKRTLTMFKRYPAALACSLAVVLILFFGISAGRTPLEVGRNTAAGYGAAKIAEGGVRVIRFKGESSIPAVMKAYRPALPRPSKSVWRRLVKLGRWGFVAIAAAVLALLGFRKVRKPATEGQ